MSEIGKVDIDVMGRLFETNVFGVMVALSMRTRTLWPEVAVFATNPWKED